MRGGINGTLQLGDQFRDGAVQVASDVANRSPIARLPRMNSDGLKQHGSWNVMGMGDEWDRHPGTDRLIFRSDLPRPPARPGGEDESARDRQHEGERNSQSAPPCFAHLLNIAGSSS
jgi:hypothetical protein